MDEGEEVEALVTFLAMKKVKRKALETAISRACLKKINSYFFTWNKYKKL